ncbi:MAG: alanine racemase [Candidatus Lindowbacteria bacterium]|nr:alanine racemase [Candidatus Lindowbacteria bacterium]
MSMLAAPNHPLWSRLRATRALIDLSAVEHNLAQIRALVGPRVEILAVVKADAYGHGAVEVARTCERAGAAMLGVALVEEGIELRRAGIRLPILVQTCIGASEIEAALRDDLTLTVISYEFAKRVSQSAVKAGITANVHADIDTGMGRIGFSPAAAAEEIARVSQLPGIRLEGVYTHCAQSELEDDPFTLAQIGLFEKFVRDLTTLGVKPQRVHAANSGTVINYPRAHLTLVRPGLIIYGAYPHRKLESKIVLKPALRFETAIVFLKDVPADASLSYGRTFIAPKPMRIATANVGYADGYPWRLSNKASVVIRGKRAPVVGRVTMDQVLIDVSSVPDAAAGDIVTLIGNDGSETIRAEDVAEWAGTISYEVLSGISKRVPREYKK